MIVCRNCGRAIIQQGKVLLTQMPPDWSIVQLQTTGEYQQTAFTIIGRIRLQLRNDYKNFWCATLKDGKSFWIVESFASFTVLNAPWNKFNQDVRNLRAGQSINFKKDLKLVGEYVEKCEAISCEGEVGSWELFRPGFFFVQASDKSNHTAIFFIDGKENVNYLSGWKLNIEKLNFKNLVVWNDWK
jgi:hypothetical protein